MQRRSFLSAALALPLMAIVAAPATAQGDVLAEAFAKLSKRKRMAVQQELSTAGFYAGGIDGRFGPGTRQALVQAAAFLAENSRGAVRPDVTSQTGARAYLRQLASGELATWLYGEGDEAGF